jgi:hypothetical protein
MSGGVAVIRVTRRYISKQLPIHSPCGQWDTAALPCSTASVSGRSACGIDRSR